MTEPAALSVPPAPAIAGKTAPAKTPLTGAALITRALGGEDLRKRLVWLTLARLGVTTALLFLTLALPLASAKEIPTALTVRTIVMAIYSASIGYALVLLRGKNLRALAIVQIGADLVAWTAIVHVTGGPASPLSFFFALTTLTAALVLGERAARITAVAAVVAFGAMTIATTSNWLAWFPDDIRRAPTAGRELAFQLVSNVVAILLVATLGGNLASRVSRAGGALARVEESRAALAALYEDVLRSIPVALLTYSREGLIDGANPGAANMFAVPVDSLLGTHVSDWMPFIPRAAFAPDADSVAGDDTLAAVSGKPRIAYRTAPLYDRDRLARGGLIVIEDRSTAEALREAVQRAERLATLGRLAAGLAHEIRNPLGAISGCVELVREGAPLGDEDRELLSTVVRETHRLNDLVGDMLAFAKPRPPELASVDLVALAREVVTLANAPGSKASVVLQAPLEQEIKASVDAARIRQVLWNLVRNAVQATALGTNVEVSVTRREGAAVELSVADRGRGIPSDERERLFEVFYSQDARGTGLGLAIVKQIVDAHGATIEIRERAGGGTEFAVVFAS